jgi:UDP-N-acetylmuramoylalanine--D-glutamate ligase
VIGMDRGDLQGKRTTIIGLAREGLALARFLSGQGAEVTVSDVREEHELGEGISLLAGLPIRFVLGGHPDELLETDIIFVSPGVPLGIPLLVAARRAGIPLSSEPHLFAELCQAPMIGITGSSGKSTTVALVGRMLEEAGWVTFVGGNIGVPLLARVDEIESDHKVVVELSSFQLELYGTEYGADRGLSPAIAAVTNITPNHLDRHGTMEAYIAAKKNIFLSQGPNDSVVLGRDNPQAWNLRHECPGRMVGFSLEHEVADGSYLRGDRLRIRMGGREEDVCRTGEIRLLGRHNVANVAAACAVAAVADAPVGAMRAIATTMTGIPHRLELVREQRGVRYYDDSIATSPERAIAALRAFDEPVILLAGGRDKHLPWDSWAELAVERVRHLVMFGEAKPIIERALASVHVRAGHCALDRSSMHSTETMEEAVGLAASLARPGDVVLLSPGGTSFDAFKDFTERGDKFRSLVEELE